MKTIKADHLGMCFGVRDAIALAKTEIQNQPVTILGELVHNETVLRDLQSRGIGIETQLSNVKTETVIITAHGTSEKALRNVREHGHKVLQATCPLVHHAHRRLRELVDAGFHPVIIGLRNHVEVRGMTDDLADFDVVISESDIAALKERSRFGIVAQTTQPIQRVRYLVSLIQQRFPNAEIRFTDTVCQPTKLRQNAAAEIAKTCDVVLVIGGANSNNTRELVGTCRQFCERVHHIQTALDISPEWFENAESVGITAGTSTPDSVIQSVEKALEKMFEPMLCAN
jgi:4-hydroxy-3-methylbut-2-enyl diphosphate reductase